MRELVALACCVAAVGCADPCAELGEPTMELGTTDELAQRFVPFDDGGELPLTSGPQVGMHVWLHLRMTNMCGDVSVDRRVVDDETDGLIEIQRGPLDFVEDESDPDAVVVDTPITMILCPTERPIIDQALRFDVRAEDSLGRVVIERKPFTPVCPTACDICEPP